jgi:Holliday junction resolvase
MESKLQSTIIRWLKSKGAYVVKTRPGAGTPVGCPDVLFLFEGAWGAIECKASKTARWRPGQEATLAKLLEWSPFVWKVYPENWSEVQDILIDRFF